MNQNQNTENVENMEIIQNDEKIEEEEEKNEENIENKEEIEQNHISPMLSLNNDNQMLMKETNEFISVNQNDFE